MEEAVDCLRSSGRIPPCLFKCHDSFYCNAENTAIPLSSASCFTETVKLVFCCFWVFNVEYPARLRLFYSFLECVHCTVALLSTESSRAHETDLKCFVDEFDSRHDNRRIKLHCILYNSYLLNITTTGCSRLRTL